MTKPILEIQSVSKKFRLGQQSAGYKTLRESLFSNFGNRGEEKEFWALKDVSFDVSQGDSIGIIGKNGAGKSTLLKILSRITPPTKGQIVCRGRIASLLEVGTGFHGELSGRENIFLNGSILGLKRIEIQEKFDEIVDFSGVEKFLDTPLKHYSSGMQLRLAFAVAAHLEPEILIIDEVLAVGDAEFQKKCLGKMESMSRDAGRTLLFVSHNLVAVQSICQKSVWIQNGSIMAENMTEKVVSEYLQSSLRNTVNGLNFSGRLGVGGFYFVSFQIKDIKENPINVIQSGESVIFEIIYSNPEKKSYRSLIIHISIVNSFGQKVLFLSNELTNDLFLDVESNKNKILINIDKMPLISGLYTYTLFCRVDGEVSDWLPDAGSFVVEGGDFYGSGKIPPEGYCTTLLEHRFYLK